MAETFGLGPKADPVAKVKKWTGDAPHECQLCHAKITDSFVDGVIHHGPWAFMCLECHAAEGVGLGLGRGQMYKRVGDEWPKVAG